MSQHHDAYKRQPPFPLDARLKVVGPNPWKPGCPGDDFFNFVLAHNPSTVGAAIKMAKKIRAQIHADPSPKSSAMGGHLA
jgi:hypothetical protein